MKLKDALLLPPRSPELLEQIKARQDLMRQMVGELYPTMVGNEINQLNQRYWEFPTEPKPYETRNDGNKE